MYIQYIIDNQIGNGINILLNNLKYIQNISEIYISSILNIYLR